MRKRIGLPPEPPSWNRGGAERIKNKRRRREYWRLVALIGFMVLVSSAALTAQTWKGYEFQRLWREAPWHVGPFYIRPVLVLSNAGFDSNIYHSPTNPVQDYTLTAGPGATVYLPLNRRFVLTAYASPQYVFFFKTERQRTWNQYYAGSANLDLRRAFLSFDWKFADAQERWNYELDVMPRRNEQGATASALIKTSRRTSIAAAVKRYDYRYQDLLAESFNVRERLNRRETFFTGSFYYQATTRRRFFIDAELGLYDFQFQRTAELKDSRSQALYGGLEFSPLGGRFRGRVRLGFKRFDLLSAAGADFAGVVGDTQVSFRVAQPFVLRGSYRRDVNFSLWFENPYFIDSRPGVGASIYLGRKVRLDYDYSAGWNRYPVAQAVGASGGGAAGGSGGQGQGEGGVVVAAKRNDYIRIQSAGIYFRVVKDTAIGFVASRWFRRSDWYGRDDRRMFYGLNLTYEF